MSARTNVPKTCGSRGAQRLGYTSFGREDAHLGVERMFASTEMRLRAAAPTIRSVSAKLYLPGAYSMPPQLNVTRRLSTPDRAMSPVCLRKSASLTAPWNSGLRTVPKKPCGTLRFAASAEAAGTRPNSSTRMGRARRSGFRTIAAP